MSCLFYIITFGSMHLAMYSILTSDFFSLHKELMFLSIYI